MRTLTVFLLVFCIVAVSSRFFASGYPSDYFTRFSEHGYQHQIKLPRETQGEVKEPINKVEDNIVPPENDVPLLTKRQLRQRLIRAVDEKDLASCPEQH